MPNSPTAPAYGASSMNQQDVQLLGNTGLQSASSPYFNSSYHMPSSFFMPSSINAPQQQPQPGVGGGPNMQMQQMIRALQGGGG